MAANNFSVAPSFDQRWSPGSLLPKSLCWKLTRNTVTSWPFSPGEMLGGATEWTDDTKSTTDTHRASPWCLLEWCKSETKQPCSVVKFCRRTNSVYHSVVTSKKVGNTWQQKTLLNFRMAQRYSLLRATKVQRCGILTATRQFRWHRWAENLLVLPNIRPFVFVLTFCQPASKLFQHDAPIRTVHWIKAPNYTCVMTGSWDKTLKVKTQTHLRCADHSQVLGALDVFLSSLFSFGTLELQTPWWPSSFLRGVTAPTWWEPQTTIPIPKRFRQVERSQDQKYAPVSSRSFQLYPMAVVGTAGRGLIIYQLENQPQEFKRVDSPLKYQVPAVALSCA